MIEDKKLNINFERRASHFNLHVYYSPNLALLNERLVGGCIPNPDFITHRHP